MNTTNQPVTTLAILAPYLTDNWDNRLEVEATHNGVTIRGELTTIDLTEEPNYIGLQYDPDGLGPINCFYPPSCCLPVLRPFSALCDPLPDGTAPAIEVAKIMGVEDTHFYFVDEHGNETTRPSDYAYLYLGDPMEEIISCDWKGLQYEAADYLRSIRFAVDLEPHQYVVK